MLDFFTDFKDIVIALAFGLLIGTGCGVLIEGHRERAEQYDKLVQAEHMTAQGIEQAVKTSTGIDTKVASADTNSDTIRAAVKKRLAVRVIAPKPLASQPLTQEKHDEPGISPAEYFATNTTACPAGGWDLDVGTVGLLNNARAGTVADTASLSNAASQAPSGIGAPEFVDNDLQVVQEYRDLAIRHDALVDYVESVLAKQSSK